MKQPRPNKRRRSTAAPGQYLGFSIQATRFLIRMLQASSGDVICLEVFEDVGVERVDGTKVAEQSKSNLVTNPLADRSVAFWKTVRNWVEAASADTLPPATTIFCLFVSKPTLGTIAASFRSASNVPDARKALDQAKSILGWNCNASNDLSETLRPHLQVIFGADPNVVAEIISRFEILESGDGDPLDDLRPLLLHKLVSEDAYDEVIRWAHGWVKERIDRLIGQQQAARIAQQEFHGVLLNYVRAHDRLDILRSVAGKPTDAEVRSELALRGYVRQANIIHLDETDLLAAVNDFLMASIDRTAWADDGHISSASLGKFAEDLSRTWKHKKESTFLAFSEKSPIDRGRLLYHNCMQHSAKLDGLQTPSHFTRGSFHALAEDRLVGWHPDYKTELDRPDCAAQSP